MPSRTIIERAFDLANSGQCASVNDIRRQLKREGYEMVEAHLSSGELQRQLKEICEGAQER